MGKSDKEWEQRRLCSDGNCIGIIGADGRCKECGLPYAGKLPSGDGDWPAGEDEANELPEASPAAPADDHQDGDEAAPGDGASDDAWENRTLCIDESCIGVVGPDGRCKECGTPHPAKQA
jgi:hypothetical protein